MDKDPTRTRFIIKGGIGNQMFIISAADAYSTVVGAEYELDFNLVDLGASSHGNSLQRYLPEDAPARTKKLDALELKIEGLARRLSPRSGHYSSGATGYDGYIFELGKRLKSVEGYFQSHKYLEQGSGLPHEILRNMKKESNWGVKIGAELESTNSLAIHVRRGDYTKNHRKLGLLDWPTTLANELSKVLGSFDSVFLFGDDPSFNQFLAQKLSRRIHVALPPPGTPDAEVLVAMTYCQGMILSNSSFSFWAARLGAPSAVWYPWPWFRGIESPSELAPDSWLPYRSIWES